MNSRNSRTTPSRAHSALVHRGPQAMLAQHAVAAPITAIHAPNAALLIDFDNVTMGIRSDLGKELRNLLSSDIIKGKVAVQRAYADWRRYPQYIVPLSEASIDLIFAPAYGSSKKNATDIRLAIDALELVFTRPEIGTFILLSGDSDFSSLVIKLKEYGKYVIGVGIRESSSDLLVQNCDEYYSYNALAGLVKANEDEETAHKWDPWELVSEAIQRMKRNGDVMRSDRLKQVMQEIDSTFDEKDLGMSKFSRFVQEAAQRGLIAVSKLENGQLEIDLPQGTPEARETPVETAVPLPAARETGAREGEGVPEERGRRRRGRGRGRDRDRDREERAPRAQAEAAVATLAPDTAVAEAHVPAARAPRPEIGHTGERLTKAEAFDLVRRAVESLTTSDEPVRATQVRARARQLLGRDSESLNERLFTRILMDAHDAGSIDLRRRGDDFEVSRAAEAAPVAEQLAQAAAAHAPPPSAPAPSARLGMGPRGVTGRGRGRAVAPPPDLLTVGVIEELEPLPTAAEADAGEPEPAASDGGQAPAPARRGTRKRGRKSARGAATESAELTPAAEASASAAEAEPAPKAKRGRAAAPAKRARRPRARKTAPKGSEA